MPRLIVGAQPAVAGKDNEQLIVNQFDYVLFAHLMATIERNLFGVRNYSRVDVAQVAVSICLLRHELSEFGRNNSHDVRGGGDDKESQQRAVDDVGLHLVRRVRQRQPDEHQVEAWLRQTRVEVRDGAGEG